MTPYEVLGVSTSCSVEDAEEAYHRLLRQHHPDLHQDAGPDAIAAAEARTRALNTAIDWIRTVQAPVAGGPGQARHQHDRQRHDRHHDQQERDQQPRDERAHEASEQEPSDQADAAWEQRWTDDRSADQGGQQPWTRPIAVCPFCDAAFGDSLVMKQHVLAEHDLRVLKDPRRRRRSFTARLGRRARGWRFIPLAFLVPFNAVFALLVATAAAAVDPLLSRWIFAVAMTPTFAVALARLSDRDR